MKKYEKVSSIFYSVALFVSFGLFVFFLLNIFNVTKVTFSVGYIFLFISLIIATLINLLLIILEKKHEIYIYEPIELIIFLSIITFLCVYPAFDLYSNWIFVLIYQFFSTGILTIVGISIFFNQMKIKENIVHAKPMFVILFSFCFCLASQTILEVVKNCLFMLTNHIVDVNIFLINIAASVIFSIIFNFAFNFSLRGNKQFINYCIIEKL